VSQPPKFTGRNRLLARLSRQDFGLLAPHLVSLPLPVRKRLEIRNRRIAAAYFPESGIASVVANGNIGRGVEVGIIGKEGMTAISVLLGASHATYETFMQIGGDGLCLPVAVLRQGMAESPTMQRVFLQHAHAFGIQVAQTAMTNARSKIEERLARWLLMAHDRMEGNELPLTHEFLATMLGVRRPGVTVALNLLENEGLILRKRATIEIVDRKGLEQTSNGAYGAAEAELRRLLD
jgi:CRP-like cAMP-binding protein